MQHPQLHIWLPEPTRIFTVPIPYPPASKPEGFARVEQAFKACVEKIGI
jgi:hypothetical protein